MSILRLSVLNIEGLKLNRLNDDLCSAMPNHLDKLIKSMTTTLINICSGQLYITNEFWNIQNLLSTDTKMQFKKAVQIFYLSDRQCL
ncbi:MAG: hypothetical protein MASP_01959 [Candidatus Methanolliviera sp. GoM_asphalt]|nr:MAG: hypothetical protein MASP_01959 [Candidatus Methanolliviera sp. GoM_asphalt]